MGASSKRAITPPFSRSRARTLSSTTYKFSISTMEMNVSGLTLFYTDSGKPQHLSKTSSDIPLVFLHGFPFDHTMWDAQVALCSPSFRVITYDHRGHGSLALPMGSTCSNSFADDLFGLLDALKVPEGDCLRPIDGRLSGPARRRARTGARRGPDPLRHAQRSRFQRGETQAPRP